jgi:hypothetical protein
LFVGLLPKIELVNKILYSFFPPSFFCSIFGAQCCCCFFVCWFLSGVGTHSPELENAVCLFFEFLSLVAIAACHFYLELQQEEGAGVFVLSNFTTLAEIVDGDLIWLLLLLSLLLALVRSCCPHHLGSPHFCF